MIKKVMVRVLFICITCISLNFLYQMFFTSEKYRRLPPYFVPDLEMPTFILIIFILAFILERYALNSKMLWALVFSIFVAAIFFVSATAIENKNSYLYEHYYKTTSYSNFTHLKEYEKQKDNRLTLKKALKNEGIRVESIEDGYTDNGYDASDPDEYQKKIYYVNDDLYIIFDWDEREITALKEKESIRQAIADQYKDMPVDGDIQNIFSAYDLLIRSDENSRHYIIEPTIENTFRFIEDGYSY